MSEVLFAPNRPKGEAHYDHRYTEAQVRLMRRLRGFKQCEIAHIFGGSCVAIHKIIKRKSWKHL
jgi:transcriptional regulator